MSPLRRESPAASWRRSKPRLGVPTLFIDGKPRPWLSYAAYNPSARVFADFEKAGVSIFSVMATATDHGYSLARTAWLSPEEFDFSQLDERMEMVLEGDANAVVIPRVYLAAPKWWCSQHPDDLVTHDTGDGKPTPVHPEWEAGAILGVRAMAPRYRLGPAAPDRARGSFALCG